MCLSMPAKVLEVEFPHSKVEVGGNVVECSIQLLEGQDVRVGDYVLVHAGYAIQKYEMAEALELLDMLREALHADTEVL